MYVAGDGEGCLGAARVGEGDLVTPAGEGDLGAWARGGVKHLKGAGLEKLRSRSRRRLSPLAVGSSSQESSSIVTEKSSREELEGLQGGPGGLGEGLGL